MQQSNLAHRECHHLPSYTQNQGIHIPGRVRRPEQVSSIAYLNQYLSVDYNASVSTEARLHYNQQTEN